MLSCPGQFKHGLMSSFKSNLVSNLTFLLNDRIIVYESHAYEAEFNSVFIILFLTRVIDMELIN